MSGYEVADESGFWENHAGWTSARLAEQYGGKERTWRRKREVYVMRDGKPATRPSNFAEGSGKLASGDYVSCKLIEIVERQHKDEEFLLAAHGFDPAEWVLVSAVNNKWQQRSVDEGTTTLYQSKITAKPIAGAFDFRRVVEALRAVEPVKVERPRKASPSMLEVPLFDMHFGNSFLEDYADTLTRVRRLIASENRAEVLLPVGSDLMHNDNFRKQTASGTPIEGMDYPRAWADAMRFYSAIIEDALRHAKTVTIVYVKGNHDESMSWAFVQTLKERYPQAVFEDSIKERKLHTFGSVAIGLTHGDKAVKDFDRIFMAEYPAFASALVKEIHTAHLHHEITKDRCGVMVRSLATSNRTDQWHRDSGFIGACKRFQVFEYESDALTAIHYV